MSEAPLHSVRLLHKAMVARDIMEIRFEKPSGFSYLAGQFVQFKIPHADAHVMRNFSLSSHPDDDHLEFCAKIIPEGKASVFFERLAVGEEAYITPANGFFVCRPEHSPRKIFIATGAGIAPIMGMIKGQLKDIASTGAVRLVFGARAPEDMFWTDRLEQLATAHPQFSFYVTISRPTSAWAGHAGRVTAHLPELLFRDADYYVCGSQEMVADVRQQLLAAGAPTKNMHFEVF